MANAYIQELLEYAINQRTEEVAEKALGYALEKIIHRIGNDHSNIWKTSLQVLVMLLKDPNNHDVLGLLHTLMSADPKRVLGTFLENHGTNQTTVKIPMDLKELRDIIREAADRRQKIKAVSAKNSTLWNNIGDSKGIIIDISRLRASLDNECLTEKEKTKNVCRNFEAGITMDAIQEKLWPSKYRKSETPRNYQVLENVTNGAGLSLAGTVSTGAHGNGLNTKIVADAVQSFQMFTIDSEWRVKRYQIEPKDGITDQAEFTEKHKDDEDNFELIQDDEMFNASVVNIGCMGVVYSYVLRTVPGFYLEEKREIYKWKDAKKEIINLYNEKDTNLYNFQVIGSPYAYTLDPTETEDHRVLISVLRRTESLNVGHRPVGHTVLPIELLDQALVAAGDSTPDVVPLLMHFSLMYLEHKTVVLNAVEALNTLSGIVEEKFNGVRTSECAMRSNGATTVITIMEKIHNLYDKIRKSNNRQLVNVPIALRFTAPTDKYMAMGYDKGRPTIAIEQSIINGTLGADDTLRQFRTEMGHMKGRPHWGMLHDMDATQLNNLYEETCTEKFNVALKYFDPKYVFENEFADWVFGKTRRNPNNKKDD